MNGFTPLHRSRVRAPLAVWIASMGDVVCAFWLATGPLWALSILYDPEPQDIVLSPWAEVWAWIILGIATAIAAASVGVFVGSPRARTALLALLGIILLAGIYDTICFAIWFISSGNRLFDLTSFGFWNASAALRAGFWLAINVWLLFSPEARRFVDE